MLEVGTEVVTVDTNETFVILGMLEDGSSYLAKPLDQPDSHACGFAPWEIRLP